MNWIPKSCTPTFKLDFGRTESGSVVTKSVSIRNINQLALTDATTRTALDNILMSFVNINAFEYSIYSIEATGKFNIDF